MHNSDSAKRAMQEITDDYHYAQQKGQVEPSYAYLRKGVEDHLEILKTRKEQKSQNAAGAGASGQPLAVIKGKGKGNGKDKGKGKTSRPRPGVCKSMG